MNSASNSLTGLNIVTDLVGGINRWVEASAGEFMLDPRHFRIVRGEAK